MREFIGTYSQRGLVIVISDFLDDNGCERALQYLSDFGHELMLLQVWTDEDRDAAVDRRTGAARCGNRRGPEAGFRRRRARSATRGPSTSMPRPSGRSPCAAAAGMPASPPASRWRAVIFGELVRTRGIA